MSESRGAVKRERDKLIGNTEIEGYVERERERNMKITKNFTNKKRRNGKKPPNLGLIEWVFLLSLCGFRVL